MKLVLIISGIVVAAAAIATAQWWTLVSVPVVWWAAFRWKPSWRTGPRKVDPARDLTAAVVELEQLRRWRVIVVTVALAAVALNGWAYLHVLTEGTHWSTSLLTTGVAFVVCVWGLQTQRRIERLEDDA